MNVFDQFKIEKTAANLRILKKHLYESCLRYPKYTFADIPERDWPIGFKASGGFGCYRSRHFLVQAFKQSGVIRLSVNRAELDDEGNYRADISWEDLQWIKDVLGYHERTAVEVFPPKDEIVNVANMRHIWILNEHLPFSLRVK